VHKWWRRRESNCRKRPVYTRACPIARMVWIPSRSAGSR
jgi:hypothetical protein